MAARIDWTTAAQGGTVHLALTIAGVDGVIVPSGSRLTTIAWTAGADPDWWLGTSPPVLPWLTLRDVEWSLRVRPNSPLDVSPLQPILTDPAGAATRLLTSGAILPKFLVTAPIGAADTTLNVLTTFGAPSSGVLSLGREMMAYAGITGASFTGLTRGLWGTHPKSHAIQTGQSATWAYLGQIPAVKGRRTILWGLHLSADGTTATNPTFLASFRTAPGAGLAPNGAGYKLALISVLKALEASQPPTRVTLAGWQHPGQPFVPSLGAGLTDTVPTVQEAPLMVLYEGFLGLPNAAATPNGGVDMTPGAFLRTWQAVWSAAGGPTGADSNAVQTNLDAAGVLHVGFDSGTAGQVYLLATWLNVAAYAFTADPAHPFVAGAPMPPAYVSLKAGAIYLSAIDALAIPPTPPGSWSDLPGAFGAWSLTPTILDTPQSVYLTSAPQASGAALLPWIATTTYIPPPPPPSGAPPVPDAQTWVQTSGGPAVLGIYVAAPDWVTAFHAYLRVLDLAGGTDVFEAGFDWAGIAAQVAQYPVPWADPTRAYVVPSDQSPGSVFRNECNVNGFQPTVGPSGRVSIARLADLAPTEPVVATLTAQEFQAGQRQAATYVTDGTLTAADFAIGSGADNFIDLAAQDDTGAGGTVDVTLPGGTAGYGTLASYVSQVEQVGSLILAPWRAEYEVASVRVGLTRYGAAYAGATWVVSEWMLPTGAGTRGLAQAVCSVLGVAYTFYGGGTIGGIAVELRVSSAGLVGYAPDALVAAGGIDAGTGVLTIDDTTIGVQGFGNPSAVGGAVDTFVAGDAVQLEQLDAVSPVNPLLLTVVSVDPLVPSITVTPTTGLAAWVASLPGGVVGAVGVMLGYQPYAASTNAVPGHPTQHQHAFLAGSPSYRLTTLAGTDPPEPNAG